MSKKRKTSAYQTALNNYELTKKEKRQKKLEKQKQIEERKDALSQYKKKRTNTFKKLSKLTSKGQPVMGARMQILLERIEKQVKNS